MNREDIKERIAELRHLEHEAMIHVLSLENDLQIAKERLASIRGGIIELNNLILTPKPICDGCNNNQ
ncbi:MAG: hypothetical protein DRP09_16070 [Candidatus Thorarchaeota archaeon]|nr:MAG: hypothetical protein DRP09_16070 [Candidatus Thorarchaeota archaeon]